MSSTPNTTPRKIIIDTDPGVDDAMAIFYALASPQLDVIGITTVFGNHDVAVCTRNALNLLDIAGRTDIPVAQGAYRPLAQTYHGAVGYIHGDDGMGNTHLPDPKTSADTRHAVEFLRDTLMASDGDITLAPLAPLTNIALLALQYPEAIAKIHEIVLMGGNAFVPGNATPTAEANIWNDPESADIVFGLGVPVTMIGLDVTHKIWMDATHLDAIGTYHNARAQHIARILPVYRQFHMDTEGRDGIHVHDSSVFSYLLHPEWFITGMHPIRVETQGVNRGRTTPAFHRLNNDQAWANRHDIRVAVDVDASACIAHELERLAQA